VTWKVEWDDRARLELRKLDAQVQRDILTYLRQRIAVDADPRPFGKPLTGERLGLWRSASETTC
jgi:mRNA interferase RelE/StbE